MGLFRRKDREVRTREVEGHDDLLAMREEDVYKFLGPFYEQLAQTHNSTRLDAETEDWFGNLLGYMQRRKELSQLAGQASYVVARLGYFTRLEEFEQFDEARGVCLPLYATAFTTWNEWSEDAEAQGEEADFVLCLVEVATRVARDDPINPGPDDRDAVMWAIPGLGAPARALLAKPALETAVESSADSHALMQEISVDDLARTWMAGFIFRHLEELFGDGPLAQRADEEMHAAFEEHQRRQAEGD